MPNRGRRNQDGRDPRGGRSKGADINQAEGERQAAILQAEGQPEALKVAVAESEAIKKAAEAVGPRRTHSISSPSAMSRRSR